MTIGTYVTLRAAISNWMGKVDLSDTGANAARTIEFIGLAENRMNRDLARVRAGEIVSTTALTTSAEAIDLPADFNGMRYLAINSSSTRELIYKNPSQLFNDFKSTAVGEPKAFTTHGKDGISEVMQCRFRPIPDAVYALIAFYYKKIVTLVGTVDATANWMLTNNPDCYLYAALLEASIWAKNDAETQKFGTLYAQALKDVKALDEARTVAGISPRARPSVRMVRGM